MNVMFELILKYVYFCVTSSGDTKFSKPAAWELLKSLGDKLSDKKTKDLVCSLLTSLSEAVGPGMAQGREVGPGLERVKS